MHRYQIDFLGKPEATSSSPWVKLQSLARKDSGQLSSMLLQTAPKVGGLAGKSLLDFFSEGDRQRISEQVLNPVENISAVALNADMLDSDFNHVQVELFCAQFKNLASERCFLVGLRELQDLEPPAPLGPSDPSRLAGNEALLVLYDVYSFDIHIMNGEMQRLCRPYFGDTTPDAWTWTEREVLTNKSVRST